MKTFKQVLNTLKISQEDFDKSVQNRTEDEVAYIQLKLIAKALNGDWVADFSDSSQRKYQCYFYYNGSAFVFNCYNFWFQLTCVGSRLCYKNAATAQLAGKNFIDIYNKFLK